MRLFIDEVTGGIGLQCYACNLCGVARNKKAGPIPIEDMEEPIAYLVTEHAQVHDGALDARMGEFIKWSKLRN
jgi:hypothetical protein